MDYKPTTCISTICMSSIVDSINTSITMKIFTPLKI